MFKKTFFLILIICLFLGGCKTVSTESTGNENAGEETEEKEIKTPVSLSVSLPFYSENTREVWLGVGGVKERFEEAYDYLSLDISFSLWDNDRNNIYDTYNEMGPDIALTDNPLRLRELGFIKNIEPFVSDKIKGSIKEEILGEDKLPFNSCKYELFINNDIFSSLGFNEVSINNLEDVLNYADAIKKNNQEVFPLGLNCSDRGGVMTFLAFCLAGGGGVSKGESIVINTPENALGLNYAKRLIPYLNGDPFHEDFSNLLLEFKEGRLAMMIAPENFKKESFNFGISEFNPFIESLFVYDCFVVFNKEYSQEKTDAIKLFFDFIYNEEYNIILEADGLGSVFKADLEGKESYPYEISYYSKDKNFDYLAADALRNVIKGKSEEQVLERLERELR